jgi:catechol 2,3-dioxygenase-like lactoylglutathione lyase family enzyme
VADPEGRQMKIKVTSVLVDNQKKALAFYTDVLGFQEKTNVPMGEHSWLTVVSPDDPNGVELVLEPDAHPAAKPFKDALVADGIPYTSFAVTDVQAEYDRLSAQGVVFTQEPLTMGPVTTAVFDDTCGNLIQTAISSRSLHSSQRDQRTPTTVRRSLCWLTMGWRRGR